MSMDGYLLYLISFFGVLGVAATLWALKLSMNNPKIAFLSHAYYPVAFHLGSTNFTRLQLVSLVLFVAVNLTTILMPSFFPGWKQVQKRAALVSVVNLTPLCMGGRAPVIDSLNMSRNQYLVIHFGLAVVATMEALSHSIITVALRPKSGALTLSGFLAIGLFLLASFVNVPFLKRRLGKWLLWCHRSLSVGAVSVILWHVLLAPASHARIIVACSCGFWVSTTAFRICRLAYFGTKAEIYNVEEFPEAIRIDVAVRRRIHVHAGSYFYLFFPSQTMTSIYPYRLLQSLTVMALQTPDNNDSEEFTSLSFIMSRNTGDAAQLCQLRVGDRLLLDGPYGIDASPGAFENLVLVAKGVGILGVLPVALHLAQRLNHDNGNRQKMQKLRKELTSIRATSRSGEISTDRENALLQQIRSQKTVKTYGDSTKKLVLYWHMETNRQAEWVKPWLQALQDLDPGNNLVVVFCGYPGPGYPGPDNPIPPVTMSDYWLWKEYSQETFQQLVRRNIKEERSKLNGSMAVIACGDRGFRSTMRRDVIRAMSRKPIEYMEPDFSPPLDRYRRLLTPLYAQTAMARKRNAESKGIVTREGPMNSRPGSINSMASSLYSVELSNNVNR